MHSHSLTHTIHTHHSSQHSKSKTSTQPSVPTKPLDSTLFYLSDHLGGYRMAYSAFAGIESRFGITFPNEKRDWRPLVKKLAHWMHQETFILRTYYFSSFGLALLSHCVVIIVVVFIRVKLYIMSFDFPIVSCVVSITRSLWSKSYECIK